MQNKFFQNPNPNLLFLIPNISGEISPESDQYSSDEFRMYDFKIRPCTRIRSHDWTDCPFAHPGEKARRRDPRNHPYSGVSCPDFRKGFCRKGDSCGFAHGVFESWLHPARYRTQICKDGGDCRRRVCFFAHSPEQVRFMPIPMRGFAKGGIPISPTSNLNSIGRLDLGGFGEVFCGGSPAVGSGRALRVKMYERGRRENGLGWSEFDLMGQSGPDFGWVSELIK